MIICIYSTRHESPKACSSARLSTIIPIVIIIIRSIQ